MNSKHRIAALAALLLAALLALPACEDSDIATPLDGVMVLTVNPAGVIIDPNLGESEKTVALTARAFDTNGLSLDGIIVTFEAVGGEFTTPVSVTTDPNGVATASLVVRIQGESPVTVTAQSGLIIETATIPKLVVGNNQEALATFTPVPQTAQLLGRAVVFDGSLSTDPDGIVTCFQWEIDAARGFCDQPDAMGNQVACELNSDCTAAGAGTACDTARFDERVQGIAASGIQRSYPIETPLTVTLRVSDNPAFRIIDDATGLAPCDATAPLIPRDRFSPVFDTQLYRIDCFNPAPTANAGPDLRVPIANANNVFLDGGLSFDNQTGLAATCDPLNPAITPPGGPGFKWNCGNQNAPIGQCPGTGATAFCRYTATGIYEATLTVKDKGTGIFDAVSGTFQCQKSATDTVMIEVFQPAQ